MGNSAPENYVLLTFSTPPTGKTDTDTTKAECFLKDPKISANLYKEVSCSKPYVFARGLHDTSVAEQDCEVAERVGIDGLINLAREICLEGKGFLSVVQKALPFSSLYVTDFDHGHCFSPEKIDIRKAGSTFGCFDGGEPKLIAEGETKTSFVTTCYADTEFDKGKALTMLFQQCKKGTFLVDADVLGQDDWKEPNGVQELLRPPSYYINIKYGHVESGRFNEMRSCYFSQKDNADLGSRADAIVCCKAGDPGNPSECKDVVSELEPEYSNLTGKLETRVCILIRSWMSTGLQNSIADHCRRSGGFLADSIQKRHERPKHRVKRSPRHFPSHHFQPICHHNPHCSEGKDDQHRP
ncbi:hypothetical protein IE53DRAFT_390558 [Violaceomyces palustris]|uniref:Uncharacterized protein n=1 Tax=Violaceomyces palustris TaxID=1673888 RepID=A0ACD0NNC2_9BASI|nr:hypothetical protein IE53DRAFT_390558 [Violaceomyces palustris]